MSGWRPGYFEPPAQKKLSIESNVSLVPSGKDSSKWHEYGRAAGPEGGSGARTGRSAEPPRGAEHRPAMAHAPCALLLTQLFSRVCLNMFASCVLTRINAFPLKCALHSPHHWQKWYDLRLISCQNPLHISLCVRCYSVRLLSSAASSQGLAADWYTFETMAAC